MGEASVIRSVTRFLALLSRDRVSFVAFIFLVLLLTAAALALVPSPIDPNEQNLAHRLRPPAWSGGTADHLLGTDALGRDIAARLFYATPLTLFIPIMAVLISGGLGTVLGLAAGFYGGKVDATIMRIVDAKMAFSNLLLIIAITIMIGTGVATLVVVFGVTGWVLTARVVRGIALASRDAPFVLAARCTGCSTLRILSVHLFPIALPVIVSLAVIDIGRFMIAEAGLSFLGFGVQAPDLTWGLVLEEGRQYLSIAVWIVGFPGLAISLSVLAVTIFGAWLRSVTDPFQRSLAPQAAVVASADRSRAPAADLA